MKVDFNKLFEWKSEGDPIREKAILYKLGIPQKSSGKLCIEGKYF